MTGFKINWYIMIYDTALLSDNDNVQYFLSFLLYTVGPYRTIASIDVCPASVLYTTPYNYIV